jgi:hypothetical protein
MMTKESLAAMINGRSIGKELTPDEIRLAKDAGLVVVFGASDDLMEVEGALCDEAAVYDGDTVMIDSEGVLNRDRIDEYDDEEVANFVARKKTAKEIEAVFDGELGYCWTYKTDIPHATFEIVEDGASYCRGIVFSVDDLKPKAGPYTVRVTHRFTIGLAEYEVKDFGTDWIKFDLIGELGLLGLKAQRDRNGWSLNESSFEMLKVVRQDYRAIEEFFNAHGAPVKA